LAEQCEQVQPFRGSPAYAMPKPTATQSEQQVRGILGSFTRGPIKGPEVVLGANG
jgi:hypothetical protein